MNDLESDDAPAGAADPPAPEPQQDPPAPLPDALLTDADLRELGELERSIDVDGVETVPAAALKKARIEARRERQTVKEQRQQLEQLSGYVHAARPTLDFLAANPGILERLHQRTDPTAARVEQPVDEGALELARTLDLYTADGQPDAVRAQKLQKIINTTAAAQSAEAVKPLQESTTRERSQYMYQRALATKTPDGRTPNREVLDKLWTQTDPRISGTEEGAAGLAAMALGLSIYAGTAQAAVAPLAPAQPVLHTESPGSRDTRRAPISALEQNIAKLRGLDDKTYAERAKGFNPGRPSQLEDL